MVSRAAELLEESLLSNPAALAQLYSTGVYYFALAYCGSNLLDIARLFAVRPDSHSPRHVCATLGPHSGGST